MAKERIANVELDARDPHFMQKYVALKGLDDVSLRIRDTRNEMFNLILYVVAIMLSVPLSIFAASENWFGVSAIIIFLAAFLFYNIMNMKKEIDAQIKTQKQLKEQVKEMGMKHPGIE